MNWLSIDTIVFGIFFGLVISDNLASISVQRSPKTMDISSIMISFTSDNLVLKEAFA